MIYTVRSNSVSHRPIQVSMILKCIICGRGPSPPTAWKTRRSAKHQHAFPSINQLGIMAGLVEGRAKHWEARFCWNLLHRQSLHIYEEERGRKGTSLWCLLRPGEPSATDVNNSWPLFQAPEIDRLLGCRGTSMFETLLSVSRRQVFVLNATFAISLCRHWCWMLCCHSAIVCVQDHK